jgi:RES domain-containing protein
MASLTIRARKEDLEVFVRWAEHLRRVDRFRLREDDERLVERIVEYSIQHRSHQLASHQSLYRARINGIDERQAKPSSEMGAPPPNLARPGRMNPLGIPYLYVALDQATAIAEVRPWLGALLSVARLSPQQMLRVVNLNYRDVKPPEMQVQKGEQQDYLAFLLFMLRTLARPQDPNDELSYIPTQYFAEKFKRRGLDGIIYFSVLHEEGSNLVLFDVNSATVKDVSLHEVRGVSHSTAEVS